MALNGQAGFNLSSGQADVDFTPNDRRRANIQIRTTGLKLEANDLIEAIENLILSDQINREATTG